MMPLLILLGVLGLPALALRIGCVGRSCDEQTAAASEVPFCSLDAGLRSRIEAGFREGRSPEVLAIARDEGISGGSGYRKTDGAIAWPSPELEAARIPIAFAGPGVTQMELPAGATVDQIAPTLTELIGFERPFPEVRSGTALEGVAGGDDAPALVLQVIYKGIGSTELEASRAARPYLEELMDVGAATMDGDVGALPLDPAAVLSTIGAGGPPRQHGVTGTFMRNERGELVRAFSPRAEVPIIATLADDLDEAMAQEPLIGLVGTSLTDRGVIGGDWYVGGDEDEVVIAPKNQIGPAVEMLSDGFGDDDVTDLMTVVMEGRIGQLDRGLKAIVSAAEKAADGSVALAVTATGSAVDGGVDGASFVALVDEAVGEAVTEAAVPGGFFLDQRALINAGVSEDLVVDELERLGGRDEDFFGDVFPAIAVSFARYC